MNNSEKRFYENLKQTNVFLHFSDGTKFKGYINKSKHDPLIIDGIIGEAAFTTGMTGYQETATDPSFLGQHIIYTSSHIGNYPSSDNALQSARCHASSLIASNFSYNEFFADIDTPLISEIDTRALVKYITNSNDHIGIISFSEETPSIEKFNSSSLQCNNISSVSQTNIKTIIEGDNPIVLVNYGVKKSIINQLKNFKLPLITVPNTIKAEEVKKLNPRLIFLSNGPGDPREYKDEILNVENYLKLNIPIWGICLGHQLLTLALGGEIIKLPFGQRGINHPCLDHVSGNILITSQNHGYASDEKSLLALREKNCLDREIIIEFKSLFDQSVEGIATTDYFLRSVQFHPESCPGPSDGQKFFLDLKNYLTDNFSKINSKELHPVINVKEKISKDIPYKKILLIGSGPIKIGQASEFDYSGSQACKALKELGLDVVLLNSNPATIMTDPEMAFQTYIEPITKETIKKIILKDNVDAVISTMGGQTALNICIDLEEDGFLKKHNVALLGSKVETIKKTEDRDLFALELDKLGFKTGKRFKAKTKADARTLAGGAVGYPLIIRRDFALGGKGAALVKNINDLEEVFNSDIQFPITMEKSLVGHKEVELEVIVDNQKNGIVICSIENIDPCGVHTGDSITVAPAQTISDKCYQKLRTIALDVAKHMGVVAGGANVQFAINPLDEDDIVVIEMNPRVSRSSALASKATGYPIAKISALLSVGFTLKEILNDITKASPVAFEPTLDYVAVKIPVFPFNKFPTSSTQLGPQMRSVGEVLALGRNFNESFMKALRSLEVGLEIPSLTQLRTVPFEITKEYIENRLKNSHQLCLLSCLEALRLEMSIDEIHDLTQISPWFIKQMNFFIEAEKEISNTHDIFLNQSKFRYWKQIGFSDKYLAFLKDLSQEEVLNYRLNNNIFPSYKSVDTCSGEFNAKTPYFYSTYEHQNEAISFENEKESVVVMGSGPNRIGQGIEFDYSCVKSCNRLKEKNFNAIMVNSNPETVSTDYDSSDRLYLTPLYSEDLFDIFSNENPIGIISSFSGQTGIKVRKHLEGSFRWKYKKFNFLGPKLETLDLTEDRKLFSFLTKKTQLSHTKSMEVRGYKNLVHAITEIGMPVIIRPSYVIGGESMYIFNHHEDIKELPLELKNQLKNSKAIFQVENYLQDAHEYDVDLIRDKNGNCVFTVCEHIEHAGVHSGDSGMISPPVILTNKNYLEMKKIAIELAELLEVIGPVNFQFAIKDSKIFCIEANPRGSRTLPFLSKAYQLSLPDISTDAMLGEEINSWDRETETHFCVKQSTFPFDRFLNDNIILGPKMRSTGETMGIDYDKDKAILKSYLGNYPFLNEEGKILLSLSDKYKSIIIPYLKSLKNLNYTFIATPGTCNYIRKQGIDCERVSKIKNQGETIIDVLENKNISLVFNTPQEQGQSKSDGEVIRNTAIAYGIPCFTRAENIKAVIESLVGSSNSSLQPLSLQDIHKERY